jgi:2,4-dienoyl-CoA reductase-like NADH-dependent reductase (Old Yellow Enzyme family)/thioredoxin reductase
MMKEKIWEPVQIGTIKTKNRIAMAPMCTRLANPDGSVSPRLIEYYEARAAGGAGMIIMEYTYIDDLASKAAICQLGIYSDNLIPGLNELAERVQYYDVKIFMQISHGGGQSPSSLIKHRPLAPSPVLSKSGEMPGELTADQIETIIKAFGEAALRAKKAGFDGVELHGVHGYLINQFLSSNYNKRKDHYGHDFLSRTRFPLEVLLEVRSKVGKDFPVGYRLNVKDFVPGGVELQETLELIKILEKNDVDYIHTSAGTYLSHHYMISPPYIERGHLVELAKKCKEQVKVPVIAVGGINHEMAIRILNDGSADLVTIGRALIADPELPMKLKEGRTREIRPCIRCNEGCIGRFFQGKTIRCATNPATGREKDFILEMTPNPKRVVIIGGGVAGMEVARIAKLKGHHVTLLEKGDRLGGNVLAASVPRFKVDLTNLLSWYENELRRLEVNVKLNFDATPSSIKHLDPEILVIAVGAEYFTPEIKGIGDKKVIKATEVLLKTKEIGQSAVIIGAGLVGVETAFHLQSNFQTKEIVLIEALPEPLLDVVSINKLSLMEMLGGTNIKMITSAKIQAITQDGVEYLDHEGKSHTILADTVILATGFVPRLEFEQLFKESAPKTYMVGNCKNPGKIIDAIDQAAMIALRI